jgi:arylsulfatase A-like enzyme
VSYVDAQIGRLLDALDSLGLADNTVVVLWGDHGWKLGEHNSWAKMTNYEIDTRAPLLIRAPGTGTGGTRVERLVEFVDIYPTLCDLAGLPLPDHLQGASAVPVMRNPTRPWKSAVFTQFLRDGAWIAPDSVPYMGYAIRTERYRYVVWMNWVTKSFVARELYDHEHDPTEDVNVADRPEYADVVSALEAQRMAGWRAARPVTTRD